MTEDCQGWRDYGLQHCTSAVPGCCERSLCLFRARVKFGKPQPLYWGM